MNFGVILLQKECGHFWTIGKYFHSSYVPTTFRKMNNMFYYNCCRFKHYFTERKRFKGSCFDTLNRFTQIQSRIHYGWENVFGMLWWDYFIFFLCFWNVILQISNTWLKADLNKWLVASIKLVSQTLIDRLLLQNIIK